MKTKLSLFGVSSLAIGLSLALISTVGTIARADHNENDPSQKLVNESLELNQKVQRSNLRSAVKNSVNRFYIEVVRTTNCTANNGGLRDRSNIDPSTLGTGGGEIGGIGTLDHREDDCQTEKTRLNAAWTPVERYLYDTYFDYYEIYQHYLSNREALHDFLNSN